MTIPKDDLLDLVETAISDSIDMDWTPKDAAEAVLRAMEKEGLGCALSSALPHMESVAALREAGAALFAALEHYGFPVSAEAVAALRCGSAEAIALHKAAVAFGAALRTSTATGEAK